MPLDSTNFAAIYNSTAKQLYNMLVSSFKSADEAVSIMNETYTAVATSDVAQESTVFQTAAELAYKRYGTPPAIDYEEDFVNTFLISCERFDAEVSYDAAQAAFNHLGFLDELEPMSLFTVYLRLYCDMEFDDIAAAAQTDAASVKSILITAYRSFMPKLAVAAKDNPATSSIPALVLMRAALQLQKKSAASDNTYNEFFDYTLAQLMPAQVQDAEEQTEEATIEDVYSSDTQQPTSNDTTVELPDSFDPMPEEVIDTYSDSPEWSRLKSIFGFTAAPAANADLSQAFELILDGQFGAAQRILHSVRTVDNSAAAYLGLLMIDVRARSIDELFSINANYKEMQNFIAANYRAGAELKDFLSRLANRPAPIRQVEQRPAPAPAEQPAPKEKKGSGGIIAGVIAVAVVIIAIIAIATFILIPKITGTQLFSEPETVATTLAPPTGNIMNTGPYDVTVRPNQETQIEFRPQQSGYYVFVSEENNANLAAKIYNSSNIIIDSDLDSGEGKNFMAIAYCESYSAVTINIYAEGQLAAEDKIRFVVYSVSESEATAMKEYRSYAKNGIYIKSTVLLYADHNASGKTYNFPDGADLKPVDFYVDTRSNTLWLAFNCLIDNVQTKLWYQVDY